MKRLIIVFLLAAVVSACGLSNKVTRESQYASMYENMPGVILVMPPINNTSHVEAKELLYTSISRPLAEAGYYVISPLLAMDILKAESAYDSELFIDKPLTVFRNYFGADAVVFSQIDDWTKRGFAIDTKIRYIIKSAITNEIIFERSCQLHLDLSVNTNNNNKNNTWALLADLTASVINTAVTDHIVAARKANYYIFRDIPRGKYSPDYLKDKNVVAEKKNIQKSVK